MKNLSTNIIDSQDTSHWGQKGQMSPVGWYNHDNVSFDHSASLAEHLRKSLTGVALRVVLRPFSRLDGVQLARSIIRHELVGRSVGRSVVRSFGLSACEHLQVMAAKRVWFIRSFGVLGERSVVRSVGWSVIP